MTIVTNLSSSFHQKKKILFFNKIAQARILQAFGKEAQIGDSIYEIILPDNVKDFDKNFASALLGERKIFDKQYSIKNLVFWFEFQYVPVKNDKRNVIGILFTARDITEKKKVDLDLKISEIRFHAIFDQAPMGMALVESKSGKFIQVNSKYTEIVGYSEKELLSLNFQAISYLEDLAEDLENMDKMINGIIQYFTMEKRLIKKDKRIIWVSLTCVPLKLDENGFKYHITIINDITETKRANEQLIEFTESLERLNATKDKFFNIIAHDLRNPFIGILNLLKIILPNFENPENKRYLELIQDSSRSAYDLLENLLHWSRSQTDDIDLFPEIINIKSIVNEVVSLFRGNAAAKNIIVDVSISDIDYFYGDEYLTSTILRNIISNAIKFTHRNGKIKISYRDLNEKVEIRISDNGVGISEDNLARLFKIDDKFTEIGTEKEQGSGLGLILCKEFVEKQYGQIRVESELGRGSTFILTLPKRQILLT